jgi:hypothetical protein
MNTRGLRLFLLPAVLVLGAASDAPLLLREQAWTARTERLAHDLTHAPGECLASAGESVEIGRALFRSPALLGGPAARAGLSCHACHANGRATAAFMLPELTDRAGAADVTSEWSSRVRGDGVMNPVDIPDLADVAGRAAFGQAREPSLERFVERVIVEEFQGEAPPQQAFDGLVAYLRALSSNACESGASPVTLAGAASDVRRALAAAESADEASASLLLLAAQDAVGRIVERLPAGKFGRERRSFEALARELGALRRAADVSISLAAAAPGWRARFDAAVARMAPRESRTYVDEATLRRALRR